MQAAPKIDVTAPAITFLFRVPVILKFPLCTEIVAGINRFGSRQITGVEPSERGHGNAKTLRDHNGTAVIFDEVEFLPLEAYGITDQPLWAIRDTPWAKSFEFYEQPVVELTSRYGIVSACATRSARTDRHPQQLFKVIADGA
jgi:hypothetical protein